MGQVFGTDGVRGTVGVSPMTLEFAVRLASAAGRVLAPNGGSVAVGKDTRISGYMFESALEAGFVAAGVDVKLLQVMPTPGIAYLTRMLGADFGVVISASHNRFDDNGIKFFDREGRKLDDDVERQIEALLDDTPVTQESSRLGRAERRYDAVDAYVNFCRQSTPERLDLSGMRVVVDGANGATYKIAPRVFADLGADVVTIACSPNGKNINDGCGSTAPGMLQSTVTALEADLGIAFDGDGDRLVMVDHTGQVIDGDQLLYAITMSRRDAGQLQGPVVGTVMSNLGLEQAIRGMGIEFHRAAVGDRNVLATLRETGGVLGGETSGHIMCLDRTTTGDGIVAAIQVLEAVRRTRLPLAELVAPMRRFPQRMINVRVERRFPVDQSQVVQDAVAATEQALGDNGRVVLRASGTEPVIRVMVEGQNDSIVSNYAEELATVVRNAAAAEA
ncbi:MAG: phosphoglucosamine mutase [Gammaproteobacteria bacterium]|nr:phosphoglucosamine mutase [Gammaproteobacteria bacterium]NNF61111.1 phosphoglucosamine mutase [Gammaproteobacteria bacterium]